MLRRFFECLLVFLALVASKAWGQSTITIQVGDTGSFFDPPFASAAEGDIINFQWTGAFHSVTQSSFDAPCTPLEGGFDSQFQGNNPGVPLVLPQWNLTITNDTEPIWFFCKSTKPMSHCISGMVGVINAPVSGSNESYQSFLAKAKALTSIPPVVVGSPILTGIGAFATLPPANSRSSPNTTSSASHSTSTTASTSTPTPTPTSKPSSGLSSGAKGGIIGGIIGAVLILFLIVLLVMSYRRGVRYRRAAVDQSRYHPPTQEIFHVQSNPSLSITRRRSLGSTADSLERDGSGVGSGSGSQTVNVKELAAEIARNMRQEHVIHEFQQQSQYPAEMPSPPLAPVPEHSYSTVPSPGYNSEFFQPPTPDSATTLLSQQQSRSYNSGSSTRQLPRPPPPSSVPPPRKRQMDAMSVDTLPAYGSYGTSH